VSVSDVALLQTRRRPGPSLPSFRSSLNRLVWPETHGRNLPYTQSETTGIRRGRSYNGWLSDIHYQICPTVRAYPSSQGVIDFTTRAIIFKRTLWPANKNQNAGIALFSLIHPSPSSRPQDNNQLLKTFTVTYIRVPPPTPSVCSDAPVPETLQEDPPGAEDPKASRTVYAGNVSIHAFPHRAPNAGFIPG